MKNIIGREKEIAFLKDVLDSKEAEFVAVYGRRRVGKTFIIREFFCNINQAIYVEFTGLKDGKLQDQLSNFIQSFSKVFYPTLQLSVPKSWQEAFMLLSKEIEALSKNKNTKNKKIIIFLDELPWLATKRSGLVQSLDYYWNTQWSRFKNLKLIVCGSAASWILDNLINAKGGLYNRITNVLFLKPFTLNKAKEFLQKRNIQRNHKQILDIYMVMGGIPHYLKQIKKHKSIQQNINDICFKKDGILFDEFSRLFKSLFDNAELNLNIVKYLATRRSGYTIEECARKLKQTTGGTFSQRLNELEAAGFVQKFVPYGKKKRDQYYKVIDEYSLFYLSWIEPIKNKQAVSQENNYWQLISKTPAWQVWAGYAFEAICYKHSTMILKKLGLENTLCRISGWFWSPPRGSKVLGAQIDLLFDRDDGVVTICEIKYSSNKYAVDKSYAMNLANKVLIFEKHMLSTKQVSLCLITTLGMKKTIWSEKLIEAEVTLADLFD